MRSGHPTSSEVAARCKGASAVSGDRRRPGGPKKSYAARVRTRVIATALSAVVLACACASGPEGDAKQPSAAEGQACPARAAAPARLPGTTPEHQRLDYWLARYSAAELDAPLLSTEDIERYQHAVGRAGDAPYSQRDLLVLPARSQLQHDVKQRLAFLRERLRDGRYLDENGKAVPEAALAAFEAELPELAPELRVALALVPMRCGPLPRALFERPAAEEGKPQPALQPVYDRNACSTVRPQEVLQLLAPWPNGMWLARTPYALGFVELADARLSPPLPERAGARFVHGPRARAAETLELKGEGGRKYELPQHASLPLLPGGKVMLASADGLHELPGATGLLPTGRPLTRRELLRTAFAFLDSPYGFGGAKGGRDCSRLQLDVFESFGIALPRYSGWQARAGSYRVDVTGSGADEKLAAIDAAAKQGAVLLAFPGHIMLYLGKNDAGAAMALHALGEYVQPCEGGDGETVLDVQRTVVSDLSLGAGSSRKSLLERITAVVVFGGKPEALPSSAESHPLPPTAPPTADACKDSSAARIFVSPARPVAGRPMRLIATTAKAVQNPALFVYDSGDALAGSAPHRLGGPPHSIWRRVDAPSAGRYAAVFMDGERVIGCKRVTVRDAALAQDPQATPEAPVWTPRWAWEEDTLNLWSAFVEQLFDDPPDDERTWTDLHTLLRNPERNLLHDHLGRGEDEAIDLIPDCADLPYTLRAYFAWKLDLPFGYRHCSRGRAGVPPACGELRTNLMPRSAPDDVAAFDVFANRSVRSGVHSASGRTRPDDEDTDLYPVALERSALSPGTVYADPYGHVLIVTKWFPQGRDPADYGILMAAEAQPDGTVGRRRFFRGSFLFDPSTKDAGAGFKQFRPLVYDRKSGGIVALDNETLAKSDVFARYSLQQYRGSKDDFYDRVDELINPAPLDPHVRLISLVDALEEAARRRVLAVDNGEKFMREHGERTMAMPSGYSIFETTGPWEDFATPSRDMRLLIAIDSVLALPAHVERAPVRYNVAQAQAKRAAEQIRGELDRELGGRKFAYTKSDGSSQMLSLADVIARAEALEVGYNPNDCVELRWGAAEDSDERASCERRAPPEQRARMERYRPWFRERTRPARGTR